MELEDIIEPNRKIFALMKTEEEKIDIILFNVLLMLSNRIYIDDNKKKPLLQLSQEIKPKQNFAFLNLRKKKQILDNLVSQKILEDNGNGSFIVVTAQGDEYAIKIIFQKIMSVGKQSIIVDFLKEYDKYKKIIIANDFNYKVYDYMIAHQIQIFKESTMMSDLISHYLQPKYELLSREEMEAVKEEYNITDYTTKKMLRTDPVAKYFSLRKGEIIRIIRPSQTSGQSVDYRIII